MAYYRNKRPGHFSPHEDEQLSSDDIQFLESVRRSATPRSRASSVNTTLDYSFLDADNMTSTNGFQVGIIGRDIMEARDRFTVYKLQIVVGNKEWIVLRRFTDFSLLNKKLRKHFPLFQLNLPPRRWFRNNFDPEFILRRQKSLEQFLMNVLAHREIARSDPVNKFLRINNPPEPHEDLETSLYYSSALEHSVIDIRKQLRDAEVEIEALTRELEDIRSGPHHAREDDGRITRQRQLEEENTNLRRALIEAQERERQVIEEMKKKKQEIENERAMEAEIMEQEKKTRNVEYKEKMLEYEAMQAEVDQRLGQLLNAFNELPNVNVNIGGRTFEVKASEAVPQQARHLKEGIGEANLKMQNIYRGTLEGLQKELLHVSKNMMKYEKQLQTRQNDVELVRGELNHLKTRYQHDVQSRDFTINDLNRRLQDLQEYNNMTEEKYFYSLVLGVKLSMAIKQGKVDFVNRLDPQELYIRLRNTGFSIENWPAWVSRELQAVMSPLISSTSSITVHTGSRNIVSGTDTQLARQTSFPSYQDGRSASAPFHGQ